MKTKWERVPKSPFQGTILQNLFGPVTSYNSSPNLPKNSINTLKKFRLYFINLLSSINNKIGRDEIVVEKVQVITEEKQSIWQREKSNRNE